MVKRSSSIMKRILQIMMMLKGLKVGLLLYVGESNVKMTSNKERELF